MGKKRKQQQQQQRRAAIDAEDDSFSHKRSKPPKQHQKEEKIVASNMTAKILKEAINQQKEIEEESRKQTSFSAVTEDPTAALDNSDDDYCEDEGFDGFSETQSQYDGALEEIDEEDERILSAFMSNDTGPQLTLADLIIQKIKEKDAEVSSEIRPMPKLDNSIIELYKGVGKLLSRYTTGKMPKAFKHIPSLELWEDVLYLTEPEKWSPNAMYQATRIFASNLGVKKAQRFYNLVLLPRVRDDIRKNQRLHFALYQALKKSLYKPAAFFKGILLPLCQSGTCSLREAVIVGSIIQKVSIPPLHSSAALMKLAEMDYCGTTSYFIKLFLDKKYALPYRVLDAVVAHFVRFLDDTRIMPVIWHQSLLAFVQRYKNELPKDDKVNLDRLIQYQKHHLVTPEIRRELKNSRNRGDEDDAMSIVSPISVINKTIEEDRWDIPEVPMEED
ncbi:bystin [Aristolochia californica]|uniref:bystin n=1 Tax=Aristolochia californica TaxID=171875 RepID=UPI0035D6F7A1